jgi:hypothetical protein
LNQTACDSIKTPTEAHTYGAVTFNIGAFMQTFINFLIVALVVFGLVRLITAFRATHQRLQRRLAARKQSKSVEKSSKKIIKIKRPVQFGQGRYDPDGRFFYAEPHIGEQTESLLSPTTPTTHNTLQIKTSESCVGSPQKTKTSFAADTITAHVSVAEHASIDAVSDL